MRSRRRPSALERIAALILALPLLCAAAVPVPSPKPNTAPVRSVPAAQPQSDDVTDLSHAIPMKALSTLPSTVDQFQTLKSEIAKDVPLVATAKSTSEALARQAQALQLKLVATAARVESLEREKAWLDADIVRLTAQNDTLTKSFAQDRVAVSHLLAILERLQHDMPPAMVLRPDDALAAAHGAMLLGASLPSVYGEAAALSRRLDALRRTRAALLARRSDAARNADYLAQARVELDQLLAIKRLEADAAATRYGDLKTRLDAAATQASDLQALLRKVAQLRGAAATQSVVTVGADAGKTRASLLCPVVGTVVGGGLEGVGGASAPGLTYATAPGAQVISPVDGTVRFAGPYHKSGLVLILQIADGYHAVLAGMDRLDVRPDDHVLAGEPVGRMSKSSAAPRLYFELRQNGRGMNPAPYIVIALRKANKT
ncbi:MAG: peptidoglycan DD-metalloendopeptidase family protein [Alphaproteobacteria bacterium]|nr:peptidoglycan DD-metalloendopeptidase family protein [Alphaproteobacteria bacterium]